MIAETGAREGGLDLGRLGAFARALRDLRAELHRRIVGQDEVITQVLAAILAEGHCLVIGMPGLAKTLLVGSVAELLSLDFKRVQFTPDLMPTDITGTTIIRETPGGGRDFHFLRGPVFANVLLADEINRTTPKTQAALMEAMEERQVSVGGRRLPLQRPFFVLATQNPIELEGTYPLPVSELDRFLFAILIDYPSEAEEFRIVVLTTSMYAATLRTVVERDELVRMVDAVPRVAIEPGLLDRAARIVRRTRPSSPDAPPLVKEFVAWGAGPRATKSIVLASKAMALMDGRPEVLWQDLQAVLRPTLRHRILLRFHAKAEGVSADGVIDEVIGSLEARAA